MNDETEECIRCGEIPRVNNTNFCKTCDEDMQVLADIVQEGGILWFCNHCGYDGAIRPSEFTRHVRDRANIKAPEPCGIEFDSCHEHSVIH